MQKDKVKILSVIVPAFKQERTIKKDLENILFTLETGLGRDYDYEVICVVDGRLDKTFEKALKVKSQKLKVFSYKTNRGKGHAVRFGMNKAREKLFHFLMLEWT